jgi:tetratricopeptide (TPR) repeat protein
MRRFVLLIALAVLAPGGHAERTVDLADDLYDTALRAFDRGSFDRAAALLERLIESDSSCARCAHLLGRSYGRLAERAGWVEALRLAQKTRSALEYAVELDPDDPDAIADLIKYYRAAPSFLGGSIEKAEALEQRLEELMTARSS